MEDLVVDESVSIKTDVKEIAWKGVEWSHLSQAIFNWRAYVNAVMNGRGLAVSLLVMLRQATT